ILLCPVTVISIGSGRIDAPLLLFLSAPILVDRGYDYQTKARPRMSQMNTKTPFALLLPLIFLAGCEEDRIATLCDTQPELCVGLHTDSWCANERNAVVRGRDLQARMPGDASLHQLMT